MNRLFIFFFCLSLSVSAQNLRLSSEASISVITCGPGNEELYSAFGHSAFRVYDPAAGLDMAYNYGVFDFDQPNFYLNFARGYLYYQLGVHPYPYFRDHYIADNRFVHEQVLNLTPGQAQQLFDYLQWNALPENTHYRYDYFYDNCATKIRDVVNTVFHDHVTFDGSYIDTHYTIRGLTDLYLERQPWGDLGIDICLGLPMDKKASPWEYMFLPDYIESGFDHASIGRGDSIVPLVKNKKVIYDARPRKPAGGLPHPLYVFAAFALLTAIITVRDLRRRKLTIWFDALLFGVTGLVGLLLFLLWFATDHQAAARNLNILWALPTHLVAVIAFWKNPPWLRFYFLGVAILSATLIATWWLLPQRLHYALIPMVVALGMRAYMQYRLRSRPAG